MAANFKIWKIFIIFILVYFFLFWIQVNRKSYFTNLANPKNLNCTCYADFCLRNTPTIQPAETKQESFRGASIFAQASKSKEIYYRKVVYCIGLLTNIVQRCS